ncbi:putative AAA_23 domain-containing protein [Vibrio chagasii]|nr:putative AAA_23 domain-containing protein [Vibrio chagasii]
MIKSVRFFENPKAKDPFSYIQHRPSIKAMQGKKIEFKEGLNIIAGPNGSGKTSILKAIAHHLAANDSGMSMLTPNWTANISTSGGALTDQELKLENYIEIEHDGQPIFFGDPTRTIGISKYGQLDDAFYTEGTMEQLAMSEESSGERTSRRMMPFLELLTSGGVELPDSIAVNLPKGTPSFEAIGRLAIEHNFRASIPKGVTTILLDEADSALSLLNQILLWERVLKDKSIYKNFQVIVVSHSSLSLDVEGAHYIDLKDGWTQACRDAINGTISGSQIAEFAQNLQHKLDDNTLAMLKRIKSRNGIKYKSESEELTQLLEAKFVEHFSIRVKPKASEDNGRKRPSPSMRRKTESIYRITTRGEHFLKMQQ